MDGFLYQPLAAPIFPEIVTVDKWFQQASEPVRITPPLRQSEWWTGIPEPTLFVVPDLDSWWQPASEPVRPISRPVDIGWWDGILEATLIPAIDYDDAPSAGTSGRFTTWGPFDFDYKNPIPPGFAYFSNLKQTIFGSDAGDIISISNHRTLALWESVVIADTSGQAVWVKLPAGAGENHSVRIMATSASNDVTVVPPSGTINGAATLTVSGAYASTLIKKTGANWFAFRTGHSAHITDADGTLADVTAQFNALLVALESLNLLKSS